MATARVEGIPVDERERLVEAGIDPDAVVAAAARVFFKMVFRDGFFHADMHPGNVFVAPDGALVAVDYGIVGRIDRPTRAWLADMLLGFLTGDYRAVAEVHFRAGYVPADQDMDAFMQAARSIGEPIFGKKLSDISLARLLAQLFEVTERFRMETQPRLLLLQKSMLVCEGVGRALNPEVNMWALARPLIESWMAENRARGRFRAGCAGAARFPACAGAEPRARRRRGRRWRRAPRPRDPRRAVAARRLRLARPRPRGAGRRARRASPAMSRSRRRARHA
jgi:ubiquinone biosynthesis protein